MPYSNAMFLDQTALLAFVDKGHDHHKYVQAWLKHYYNGEEINDQSLTSTGDKTPYDRLVTSDWVVAHVAETLKVRYNNFKAALTFVNSIRHSTWINILHINREGFLESCRKMELYSQLFGFELSLVDASTIFLLRSSRIKGVMSYQKHLHRLDYLTRELNLNTDPEDKEGILRFDARPDSYYTREEVEQEPFLICEEEFTPAEAKPLFDLQVWGFQVCNVEKTSKSKVHPIIALKLCHTEARAAESGSVVRPDLPSSFSELTGLERLDLSENFLSTCKREFLDELNQLTNLKKLDLSGNGFREVPKPLRRLESDGCEILVK